MTKIQPIVGKLAIALCCLLCLTTRSFAREKTDVILMKNGDRFTGEIKGLKAGVLYVNMKYILGTSSVDWSEVAQVQSRQLFLIKTEDGSVYTGTLNTTGGPGGRPVMIEVAEVAGPKVEIDPPKIVMMDATSTNFVQRLNGSISSGIIYSKGNQSTQYNLGAEINYPRERWAAGASYNSTLADSTGANASTRNQLSLDAYHLMRSKNWFYDGIGVFLQSSEQGIGRQITEGAGIGRYLKNTNRAQISVFVGLAGQNTSYIDTPSQNQASGLIATSIQFFRFDKTNAEVTAFLLPAISEPGRVKFNLNATYYLKIVRNLDWNVSFYSNFDNEPPNHLSGSDFGSSSGLSWKFGK